MRRSRRPSAIQQLREGEDYLREYGLTPPPASQRPTAPVPSPKPSANDVAEAQAVWQVVGLAQSGSTAQRYRKHQAALQALEDEKLNRLQIMKWAQETRSRFLRLSMANRKLFLEVLTADENQAFSTLFALQGELDAAGVTDDNLKMLDAWEQSSKSGAHVNDCVAGTKKEIKRQKKLQTARETLQLPSSERPALPKATLSLPGAKS